MLFSRDDDLTKPCDEHEHEVLPLSCEIVECSFREPRSMNLGPTRIDPKLCSELVDSRGVLPESVKSNPTEDVRSVLGLSELINDMSVSDSEKSINVLTGMPLGPLRIGDLIQGIVLGQFNLIIRLLFFFLL
ncbi:hypothetical protein HS088_TW12G00406 [Tripterygium wilfordii]|uniref:Uncharacterized protein n=1 Tax=Tripterygium wilfordii TaxID=458696 RepID=A0A7J7CYM1_TRIWF|nr:hypothetical protein HS088_TW12G00406 [Tripterygium wilfordii]